MTKATLISAVFAAYVAVMLAIAAIPGAAPEVASQLQPQQASNRGFGMDVKFLMAGAVVLRAGISSGSIYVLFCL